MRRDLVLLIVEQVGHQVCPVGRSSEAYEATAQQQCELAIIDIALPDLGRFAGAANLDGAALLVSGGPASYRVWAAEFPSEWQCMLRPIGFQSFYGWQRSCWKRRLLVKWNRCF